MRLHKQDPDTGSRRLAFCGKIKCREIIPDQWADEPQALARTSAQREKHRRSNFYNINEAMYLVDLPGYGYAKVFSAREGKMGKMIEAIFIIPKSSSGFLLWISAQAIRQMTSRCMTGSAQRI